MESTAEVAASLAGAAGPRLARQVAFVLEADRLKGVLRRNPVADGSRRENDAEHSWQLALMAIVLAEHAPEGVDAARVTAMLVLHDVVEIDAGDTFAYDPEAAADQSQRERLAADRLFALLPADQARDFRALWEEFDAGDTPEARFAVAVDRLAPMLLNFHAGGGTWATPGVGPDDVLERGAAVAEGAEALGTCVRALVAEGAARGFFDEEADDRAR